MQEDLGDFSRAEYRQLRRTVGSRSQLKAALMVAGLGTWAAVLTVVLATLPYPLAAIVPLLLLVGVFEVLRPLHFSIERIGRYLQVFYEEAGNPARPLARTPAWERTAMVFGGSVPGAAGHPLYGPVFGMATLVNFLAVALPGPVPAELALMAVPHLAFLAWLMVTDRALRAQRRRELARYRDLYQRST